MRRRMIASLLTIFLLSTITNAQLATQWRGQGRTGFYPTRQIMHQWPEEGPELLLHLDSLPESYSSVVYAEGILYTTGIEGDDEFLQAINMDGQVLWTTRYGRAWENSYRNARTTPTIEDGRAWMISGQGDVACVSLEDGKLLWSLDGKQKYGGRNGNWGTAESPLIVNDKVIFTPGGEKTTMVALDKNSGDLVWESISIQDKTSYCSPVLAEIDGYPFIISVTSNYIISVHAETGEIFWKFKYTDIDSPKNNADINPVTPIVIGDEVFVTSGYNHVALKLKIAYNYRSASLVWKNEVFDVHHGGVVYHDGYLYASNYTFITSGNWVCIDWEKGKLQYEADWNGKGSVILADGHLICYDERRGFVALVKADPDAFNVISSFKVEYGRGPHWSHPSIYDDKLFIRHGRDLMVYDLGEK